MPASRTRSKSSSQRHAVQQNTLLPDQEREGMQKIFIADDKFPDVIDILERRRGWTRSKHTSSPNFQLKWRNLGNINFRLLRPDQYVNHIRNAQHLSNKALLADHLAFARRESARRRRLRPGASLASQQPDEPSDAAPNPTLDDAECYFPECFNVASDGFRPLLEAFAVSASVALLRRALENEDEDKDKVGGVHGLDTACSIHAQQAALSAAVSVLSRHAARLRRQASSYKSLPRARVEATPCTSPGGGHRESGTRACYAQDAAACWQRQDCIAVLIAWEATVMKEETSGCGGVSASDDDRRQARPSPPSCGCCCGATSWPCWGGLDGSLRQKDTHDFLQKSGEVPPVFQQELRMSPRTNSSSSNSSSSSCQAAALGVLREYEHLDPQSGLAGRANAWVVKPAGQSCGRGVSAASSLRRLVSACRELECKAVVQKYVERPLLIEGMKFDIRQWVLLTSCNPLVVWGFDESYVRFSSRPFTVHASSLSDRFVHLCNNAVQRERPERRPPLYGSPSTAILATDIAEERSPCAGTGCAADRASDIEDRMDPIGLGARGAADDDARPAGSRGHMWSADQLRAYLLDHFDGRDVYNDVVLPRLRAVVIETLLSVREELEIKGRALEWLGFDVMLTDDLRVLLLEVNVSPDVSHSTPVTARLVPPATADALSLLLDRGVAEARAAAAAAAAGTASATPFLSRGPRFRAGHDSAVSVSEDHRSIGPTISCGQERGKGEDAGGEIEGGEAGTPPAIRESREHVSRRERAEGHSEASSAEASLRWQLWFDGEPESQELLSGLRDAKRQFFNERRLHAAGGQSARGFTANADDDDADALRIVDDIVKAATAAVMDSQA